MTDICRLVLRHQMVANTRFLKLSNLFHNYVIYESKQLFEAEQISLKEIGLKIRNSIRNNGLVSTSWHKTINIRCVEN